MLLFLGFFITTFAVPAVFLLGYWFLLQVIWLDSLRTGPHLGGMVGVGGGLRSTVPMVRVLLEGVW